MPMQVVQPRRACTHGFRDGGYAQRLAIDRLPAVHACTEQIGIEGIAALLITGTHIAPQHGNVYAAVTRMVSTAVTSVTLLSPSSAFSPASRSYYIFSLFLMVQLSIPLLVLFLHLLSVQTYF